MMSKRRFRFIVMNSILLFFTGMVVGLTGFKLIGYTILLSLWVNFYSDIKQIL